MESPQHPTADTGTAEEPAAAIVTHVNPRPRVAMLAAVPGSGLPGETEAISICAGVCHCLSHGSHIFFIYFFLSWELNPRS